MNIIDKIDNSTFTLSTYSANSIVISPQIRVTDASLIRFLKYLLDKFRESKLMELEVIK
jgi:hypothetical protein